MEHVIKKRVFVLDMVLICIGVLISSVGINMFLSNAKLLSGGATGIALIFQYLWNIPSGIMVFIINIPLFVLSFIFLPKRFTIYTAIGMFALSSALIITKPLANIIKIDDILLYCVCGGAINGIGGGIIFCRNGSTGGFDIISMMIRKKHSNFEIGKLNFCFNLIIVTVGACLFGLPQALYTLISMYIQSMVIDKVINGSNSKKLMLVLTDKETEIINYVLNNMHRGITSIKAEGEYTKEDKKLLYIAVTTRQMVHLRIKILEFDPSAFITIIDVSEVKGEGFKSI